MSFIKIGFIPGGMKVYRIVSGSREKDQGASEIIRQLASIQANENGVPLRIQEEGAGNAGPEYCSKIAGNIAGNVARHDTENIPGSSGPAMGGSRIFVVSGDHSATYHAFRAFAEKNREAGRDVGLILVDSHPDCRKEIDGEKDWLRRLAEEGVLEPGKIAIVGARSILPEEHDFILRNRIRVFGMKRVFAEGIDEIADIVMENARGWGAAYVSIDMDAIDPAFAPGVEAPEPGGFSSREIIAFVQRIRNLRNLLMADVCEAVAAKDRDGMTSRLAAKIMAEFI
jgi:arginase family enzyme